MTTQHDYAGAIKVFKEAKSWAEEDKTGRDQVVDAYYMIIKHYETILHALRLAEALQKGPSDIGDLSNSLVHKYIETNAARTASTPAGIIDWALHECLKIATNMIKEIEG